MTRVHADRQERPNGRRAATVLTAVALGVLGVMGLGLDSASQVDLTGSPLGAGATTVASCQPAGSPIAVSLTSTWSGNPAAYRASAITLSGIDGACAGLGYKIRVLGASDASIVELSSTATIPATGTVTHAFPTGVRPTAASIVSVAVVIQ